LGWPELLRDCTLASELPHEIDEMAFTKRILVWFDALVGVTVDSVEFTAACSRVAAARAREE
jgi:hypothetical protein